MSNVFLLDMETGTNGSTPTKAALGVDILSSGGTWTISTAHPSDGTRCLKMVATGDNVYLEKDFTSQDICWFEWTDYFDVLPTANTVYTSVKDTTGAVVAQVQILYDAGTSKRTMRIRDAGSQVWASTAVITTGSGYRFAWYINKTTGKQQLKMYTRDSSTPMSGGDSGLKTFSGTNKIAVFQIGSIVASTMTCYFDSINCDNSTERGPLVTAPTVTTGSGGTIIDGQTFEVTSSISGTYSSAAWSVESGPSTSSSQFASTSDDDTDFTPAGGPGTYTLRRTATYSGGTAWKTVVVVVTAPTSEFTVIAVSASGSTVAGSSAVTALTDGDNATYVRSPADPSAFVYTLSLSGGLKPPSGQSWTFPVRLRGPAGSSFVPTLKAHDGTTVKALSAIDIDDGTPVSGVADTYDHLLTWTSSDWSTMPDGDWIDGPILTLSVSV